VFDTTGSYAALLSVAAAVAAVPALLMLAIQSEPR